MTIGEQVTYMQKSINWGILGTGDSATRFANSLKKLPNAKLLGIGSRSLEKAKIFAKDHNIPRAYGSYAALTNDPDIDIIHIATPHSLHCENTILCLTNGKAVLCEKPMALNAREVHAMIQCAQQKQIFLMEAMWTRCLPVIVKVQQWLKAKKIGDIRFMSADFCRPSNNLNPKGIILNRKFGGGALLDIGVYPLALAHMVFGKKPDKIIAEAILGKTGVDEQTVLILKYGKNAMAQLACSIHAKTPGAAIISGTKGTITIHAPFWHGTSATLAVNGKKEVTITGETGYQFEAAEAMRCLKKNLLESNTVPLTDSIAIAECLDEIRCQIGLVYLAD
jgi:dihydrodiol dehydrogenase / D-xylose 1-dehydrogenase (NADP)